MDRLSNEGRAAMAPPGVTSAAEWQTRVDLAACYRLCALYGWDDVIYTHITAAVPDQPGHYLVNPFGLRFDEVRASNLVKVDHAGEIVCRSGHPINRAGFALHAAVHGARPELGCVIHLHNANAIAVGAQGQGLLPLSSHALRFYQQLGYHDYEGLVLTAPEAARLVKQLGAFPALLLRNHGSLVCGRTVAEALVRMETLDKACGFQLKTQAGGAQLHMPPHDICVQAQRDLEGGGAPEGALEWPALLRKLDQLSPDYRS
jgi:ribulose-5-phosphate 4-epimerase/fuculose-1-phosphate aldolase